MDIDRCIGSGRFGVVHLATVGHGDGTYETVTVKNYAPEPRIAPHLSQWMRAHTHENIVRIHQVVVNAATGGLTRLIMEHCEGEDLLQWHSSETALSAWTTKEIESVSLAVGRALCFLHEHNIVHRDVKPENILVRTFLPPSGEEIDPRSLCLADFDLCEFKQAIVPTDNCGTLAYMAPELFTSSTYGYPVDMYSLGMCLLCLLLGYHPYLRNMTAARLDRGAVFLCMERWKRQPTTSHDLEKDILRSLLTAQHERLTAAQWLAAQH